MVERAEVYKVIDGERDYQVTRWNRPTPDRTIDEWAMYFEVYARKLSDLAASTGDDEKVTEKLDIVRKLTAMGVACMEQHGAPERKIAPPVAPPKPALCRLVLYNHEGGGQYPAVITEVWSDTCVNLLVFADTQGVLSKTSVLQGAKEVNTWQWPSMR